MLLPQVNIKIRCNNQVTLTRGNYRARAKEISQAPQLLSMENYDQEFSALTSEMAIKREYREKVDKLLKPVRSAPLGIIKKSQRSKKTLRLNPHKPKSFTRFSGQRVRESGAAMEIACGGDNLSCYEVTLTIPANHTKAYEAIAIDSDYAINRLFEPIRKSWGKDAHWFYVWEYQKRGALHLHIAIYHPEHWECACMAAKIREQWHKVLCDIGERRSCCLFTQKRGDRCWIKSVHSHHIAPIKKSVGRYFAKYAGKIESKQAWYCQAYPVSRFWGSSKAIKNIVKENSFEFTWDMMGGEKNYDRKFEEIIESLLEKLSIVSCESYDFNVTLKGKHRLNRYKNGRKIIAFDEDRCVANGTRYTFYTTQEDFQRALELARLESNFA